MNEFDKLVQTMIQNGWTLTDGRVIHDDLGQSFETWFDAIVACIRVASE